MCYFFFFQAEDGIRDGHGTGVQTCALPIYSRPLIDFMRTNPQVGPRIAVSGTGHERVPQIRKQFDSFLATEEALAGSRDDRARRTARVAVAVGGAGFTAALLLILAAAGYL